MGSQVASRREICEFGPTYFTYRFVLTRDFSLFLWETKVAPHVGFQIVRSVDSSSGVVVVAQQV